MTRSCGAARRETPSRVLAKPPFGVHRVLSAANELPLVPFDEFGLARRAYPVSKARSTETDARKTSRRDTIGIGRNDPRAQPW
jgi:hypothetical protein